MAGSGKRSWVEVENQLRVGKFRRNEEEQKFLLEFNAALEVLDQSMIIPDEEPYPIIMYYGVPRCGKTFFSQALRHAFNPGVIDNLAARFWLNPAAGLKLSRMLKVDDNESYFESNYGKTSALSDPHDFSYFWNHWLKIDRWPYDSTFARGEIDFTEISLQLRKISNEWGRIGLMKGVLPSYHLSQMYRAYKDIFYIQIERDLVDVAYSMLRGRREHYDDENRIYGQVRQPSDVPHYETMTAYDSVANQIRDLLELYALEAEAIPSEQHLTVNYGALCKEPQKVVSEIIEHVEAAFGITLANKRPLPSGVARLSKHGKSNEDVRQLEKALIKVGLSPRF